MSIVFGFVGPTFADTYTLFYPYLTLSFGVLRMPYDMKNPKDFDCVGGGVGGGGGAYLPLKFFKCLKMSHEKIIFLKCL